MTLDIKKYKKYVENGSYQSSTLDKLSDRYSQQEQDSISHFDILINSTRANSIYKNGTEYKCIVDYGGLPKKSGLSNLQHVYYREVLTKQSDSIKAGDIVEFAHKPYELKKNYMFIKTVETRDGYDLSIMQECNHDLKWLDNNGNIRSYPSLFFFNSRSNFGTKDDRVMTLPDGRRQVVAQRNKYTSDIQKNQRFIFGGLPYTVIDMDAVSEDGLVNIILKDDLIDSALDNLELGIANYYGKIAVYSIVSLDGNKISERAGRTHQIHAQVLNNGRLDSTQTIVYQSSNEAIATVDENGLITTISNGSSVITLSLASDPSIKTTINLTVQLVTPDNYTVKIIGENTITMGFDEHYQIEVRNNGILDVGKGVNWTILAQDGVSTTTLASFVNNQITQCKVKGNAIGYVKLKCVLQGYSAVVDVKQIQIKSIL